MNMTINEVAIEALEITHEGLVLFEKRADLPSKV